MFRPAEETSPPPPPPFLRLAIQKLETHVSKRKRVTAGSVFNVPAPQTQTFLSVEHTSLRIDKAADTAACGKN